MKNIMVVYLTFIVIGISAFSFASNLKVSNLEDSIMKRDSGNVWVSLKATVTNQGNLPQVMLRVQAVDRENQTMKNFVLKGIVPPGSTGELIGAMPVSEYEYKKIVKWIAVE